MAQEYASDSCRNCSYPLFGVVGQRCPECGDRSLPTDAWSLNSEPRHRTRGLKIGVVLNLVGWSTIVCSIALWSEPSHRGAPTRGASVAVAFSASILLVCSGTWLLTVPLRTEIVTRIRDARRRARLASLLAAGVVMLSGIGQSLVRVAGDSTLDRAASTFLPSLNIFVILVATSLTFRHLNHVCARTLRHDDRLMTLVGILGLAGAVATAVFSTLMLVYGGATGAGLGPGGPSILLIFGHLSFLGVLGVLALYPIALIRLLRSL